MIRQNLHSELLKRIREKRRFMQVLAGPRQTGMKLTPINDLDVIREDEAQWLSAVILHLALSCRQH
jgi:hypothetical protein